jgi:hypothetical protein
MFLKMHNNGRKRGGSSSPFFAVLRSGQVRSAAYLIRSFVQIVQAPEQAVQEEQHQAPSWRGEAGTQHHI